MVKKDVVILGSGLSGLIIAKDMVDKGNNVTIIDKNKPGGMQKTIRYDGEEFSPFGCFLFKEDGVIEDFMSEISVGLDKQKRKMKVFYDGKRFKYPFQSNLSELPLFERVHIWLSYLKSYLFDDGAYSSFNDWAESKFGKKLANMMIIPHTRKKYGFYYDMLEYEQFTNKLKIPNMKELGENLFNGEENDWEFDSEFYSPKGGMGVVIGKLFNYLVDKGVHFIKSDALRLSYDQKIIELGEGNIDSVKFNKLISTIPINKFHPLNGFIDFLVSYEFRFASLSLFTFILPKNSIQVKEHAEYFPNEDQPWHRIIYPKNYQEDWDKDFDVVTFEVPNLKHRNEEYSKCIKYLFKRFGCHLEILNSNTRTINSAYPLSSNNSRECMQRIESVLKDSDVYLFGRSAKFKYIYLPDIIKKSDKLSEYLTKGV
jgi:protoporphyrinogen oxidase